MDRMTKERYDLFRELREEVTNEAVAAFRKMYPESFYPETLVDADETDVTLEGDEYWSYGGHEHHCSSIPLAAILDEQKAAFWDAREQVLRAAALVAQKKAVKEKTDREARDRAKLAELKAKYES